jgi:diguanylate cyclase (GGDEF)-like protein
MRSKEKLLEANEREIQLITEEITFQVENAKKGALYVENIIGRELRTVSIAAQKSLPPRHEDVTNEQLEELAKELMVSHITLFAETEGDIVGVKSSDPHEMNLSTKEWDYWYIAFQQLLDLKPVDVEEGLTLPNYWTGPIEKASSNPEHTDKWGYYDGTTNYIIDPFVRDSEVLEYEELFGPGKVIERFTEKLDGMLEITVFNPLTFGEEKEFVNLNGNSYIRISAQPVWYGSYNFINEKQDQEYIRSSIDTGKTLQYSETINDKNVRKTFVPVQGDEPFVIGITYDYGLIEDQLKDELMEHILLLVVFMAVIFGASFFYSRSITKPISYVVGQVNEIAKGNFGKRLTMKRKDEFGVLAQNVNALSESLKEYTDDLEHSKKIIEFQAYHDPLTSLPNRRYIKERIEAIKDSRNIDEQQVSVIFLDVDRFKHVNDTLGHNVGDELIKEIGKRVLACVISDHSVVARQGGDEFIILLENHSEEESLKVAERIVQAVKKPYLIEENELYVSASCGISMYPNHSEDLDTLIMYSDMAMYAAKNVGGNKAVLYNESMSNQNKERAEIEKRLRKAIEEDRLEVYFQPKVNAKSNQITGVEALVRWTDEEIGFVSPGLFIPIAEDTGLIQPMWEQVMRKSCTKVSQWNKETGKTLSLSVNFSAKQFQDSPQIVGKVQSILKECHLSPELFEIEITESVLMYNTKEIMHALQKLQATGIKIAIDDFGTGYSSMSYLKDLPINTLKIDQSFIQDIKEDYENSEIALAIINLAKSLKLDVIAEGVEKEHQKQYLIENNCEHMQGFYFSKPIPAKTFEEQYLEKL